MRAVFALVLVVGMALAGAAVYMVQTYMGQTEAALARANAFREKTGKLVQVYAVNKSMKFGDPLTAADVVPVYIQEAKLPAGAFLYTDPAKAAVPATTATTAPQPVAAKSDAPKTGELAAAGPLFPADTDKPRFLMRSVEPNEILLASRVTEPGEAASLTGKLERGMRAFQIKVDTSSGVQSFVMPDAFIDIYWTGTGGDVSGEITRLIESAVTVIAVDQASGEGQMVAGNARTVTVAATPEQVGRLAQAQATGRLTMSLVASPDDAVEGLVEIDRDKLLGVEKKAEVVEAAAPEVCTIKTRKGDAVVEVPIPCTN
ncbi:MAG: Flp pilus assembly protein CpaB [Rhodobacteraceae bacterium]|jgi:pilus assembly protein CpaB|nr:Flp pilus assembly protein CpaB [Paracoccaceae bacterium]